MVILEWQRMTANKLLPNYYQYFNTDIIYNIQILYYTLENLKVWVIQLRHHIQDEEQKEENEKQRYFYNVLLISYVYI